MENADWFLLQYKPNSHQIAVKNLSAQGFKTFVPLQRVTRRFRKTFKEEIKPLFPGYMFVSFDPHHDLWRSISSTFGVSKLITFGNRLTPLPIRLIKELKKRTETEHDLCLLKVKKGYNLKISRGPFADFLAQVENIEAEKRVWVLLDLLGQKSRVRLNLKSLELC